MTITCQTLNLTSRDNKIKRLQKIRGLTNMKNKNTDIKLQGKSEKIRAIQLDKKNKYYARMMDRTPSAISQAFSGLLPTLLKRITTHNNYLESKIVAKKSRGNGSNKPKS